jgi:diadenosine tetraphosphate (Ap4A) HIT family hydrolase
VKRFLYGLILLGIVVALWFVPVSRNFLARTLFTSSLNPSMGKAVGWGFEYASPLLPVKRVSLRDKTIAFDHPRPSWSKHVLVIPRKQITSIFDLLQDKVYLESVYQSAHDVFVSEGFDAASYALLVNGGIRQDVKQVHFHLHEPKDNVPASQSKSFLLETKDFMVYQLSEKPLHLLLEPALPLLPLSKWTNAETQQLANLEIPLETLEQRYQLSQRGFSIILREDSDGEEHLVIHLTAGSLQ